MYEDCPTVSSQIVNPPGLDGTPYTDQEMWFSQYDQGQIGPMAIRPIHARNNGAQLIMHNPDGKSEKIGAAVGVAVLAGALILPTFVIVPWVVKAFKPEWGYGRRLAAGVGFSMVMSALAGVARAAGQAEKK